MYARSRRSGWILLRQRGRRVDGLGGWREEGVRKGQGLGLLGQGLGADPVHSSMGNEGKAPHSLGQDAAQVLEGAGYPQHTHGAAPHKHAQVHAVAAGGRPRALCQVKDRQQSVSGSSRELFIMSTVSSRERRAQGSRNPFLFFPSGSRHMQSLPATKLIHHPRCTHLPPSGCVSPTRSWPAWPGCTTQSPQRSCTACWSAGAVDGVGVLGGPVAGNVAHATACTFPRQPAAA